MLDIRDRQRTGGDTVDAARLRGLLETAWPGFSAGLEVAAGLGVCWNELSSAHLEPSDGPPVAHAGVFDLPWRIAGEERNIAGIHAVCVHPLHRGRGLMRAVMSRALAQCDAMERTVALFTVEPDLYRRFGFHVVAQSVFEMVEPPRPSRVPASRKLSCESGEDVALLKRLLAERTPLSDVLATTRLGGPLFLLNEILETGGFERLRYLPSLETVVAIEQRGATLAVLDVVAPALPPLPDLLRALDATWRRVELHFVPDRFHATKFRIGKALSHEVLMVRGSLGIEDRDFIVPDLARP
jgi:GNAT superfamily N-acetyltransferase